MRRKLFLCVLLCLALALFTAPLACADSLYVGDAAGLLTVEERAQLEADCAAVAEAHGCGVYIVTVPDYTAYGYSVESAAEAIYDGSALGVGGERNGILLLLSMAERDYDLAAYGSFAHTSFTDYGKELLADSFLDNFRRDDWYGGFSDFVREAAAYMDYAESGSPVDVSGARSAGMSLGQKLLIIILVPCLVALVVCVIFRAQMKTAKKQTRAANYVVEGGVNMRIVRDMFTHRTQTVQVIQRNNGGGHGGTSINAGGFSHHSGKF